MLTRTSRDAGAARCSTGVACDTLVVLFGTAAAACARIAPAGPLVADGALHPRPIATAVVLPLRGRATGRAPVDRDAPRRRGADDALTCTLWAPAEAAEAADEQQHERAAAAADREHRAVTERHVVLEVPDGVAAEQAHGLCAALMARLRPRRVVCVTALGAAAYVHCARAAAGDGDDADGDSSAPRLRYLCTAAAATDFRPADLCRPLEAPNTVQKVPLRRRCATAAPPLTCAVNRCAPCATRRRLRS